MLIVSRNLVDNSKVDQSSQINDTPGTDEMHRDPDPLTESPTVDDSIIFVDTFIPDMVSQQALN